MVIDPLNIIAILTACVALVAYARLIRLGIVEAWLPVVCLVAYILLEFDWVVTDQAAVIGSLREYAWSLAEIGIMGGGAIAIYRLKAKCRELEHHVKEALRHDD